VATRLSIDPQSEAEAFEHAAVASVVRPRINQLIDARIDFIEFGGREMSNIQPK
jgi:3-deoxy-D-arabino-heptulosonate 7-phosphate (DAHP) synthase